MKLLFSNAAHFHHNKFVNHESGLYSISFIHHCTSDGPGTYIWHWKICAFMKYFLTSKAKSSANGQQENLVIEIVGAKDLLVIVELEMHVFPYFNLNNDFN